MSHINPDQLQGLIARMVQQEIPQESTSFRVAGGAYIQQKLAAKSSESGGGHEAIHRFDTVTASLAWQLVVDATVKFLKDVLVPEKPKSIDTQAMRLKWMTTMTDLGVRADLADRLATRFENDLLHAVHGGSK